MPEMTKAKDDRDTLFRRQKLLADFGDFALQSDDLTTVLTEACRLIAEALSVRRAKVLEIDEGGQSLFVRVGVGWSPDIVGSMHIPMGKNSSESFAIKVGKPVISRNIHEETRFGVPDFMKEEGVVALANVPIFLPGKRAYGLLQVDHTEPRDFDEADTEFLRTYAAILGPVIDRVFKLDDLRESEQRFRLTVETATDYAIFTTDRENRITDWLPGAAAVFGWDAEEAVGKDASILYTPEDREAGVPEDELETARKTGSAPDVREHLRKDGSRVFIEGVVRPLYDGKASPQGFLKIGQDASERRESDRCLRDSEERYRSLASLVPALLWQADATATGFALSPSWLDYTGQSSAETQAGGWLAAVHPDDRSTTEGLFAKAYSAGEAFVHQHRIRSKNGDYRWFLIRHLPWRDDQGRIVRWFGAATDIHELHELQERQAIMVAELQHRTRNLIGVVRSIANQTMARTGPTEAFRRQFNDRLGALSRIQGLLSRADQEPITFGALVDVELEAVGAAEDPRVTLKGPSVRIRPAIVQTLALAIHELAANARNHGALSSGGGTLDVTWQLRGDGGERRLVIEWREDDLARGEEARALADGGYGQQLIERALPHTLGAETRFDLASDRLRCTIDLPLDWPTEPTGQ
ncbi:PAS domain S-box protein [Citreimonas salinaria]|uniref:histidine kinase n=1 Tax=Citreimonas salinaria TaxID=321339 RepID=A0A1H3NV33_9RHOB|nr:PAS domain S-box protein [Citreimonas salinaria]SDY92295.1 PAS domain S-box-containing protein [Citreimonas salinaria]